MAQPARKRTIASYAIVVWMIFNIILIALAIIDGDVEDLNNWIEIALWVVSITGLLLMRKWGIAFTIFTLSYTLSTSVGILIYYQIWINALRVIVNVPIIIYLFKLLLESKPK
jgi:hypothetical protein